MSHYRHTALDAQHKRTVRTHSCCTYATTTLLELKFGGRVPSDEAQGEQFADRLTPQPFAHPPMHRRQREAPPVRARGKKRPVAARLPDAVPGCALPPSPENCSSPAPARHGDEIRPSGAPDIDPSPAPFSPPHDTAPPSGGDGHTRPAPPGASGAGSHSSSISSPPAAPGPGVTQVTSRPAGSPPPASSAGRETSPATPPWRLHARRCCARYAGVV